MFKQSFFRRSAALLMSVLMLVLQLGAPTLALAQDVSALPMVLLSWVNTADGSSQSTTAGAMLYADAPIYWARVPAEALQNGMTIEVLGNGDPALTYVPAAGSTIYGSDAALVDGNPATYVEVYRDGVPEGRYPLYLSASLDVPPPQQPEPPTEPSFDPVYIRVNYYDENNNAVGGYDDTVPMGGKDFAPEWAVPEGYALRSYDHVFVDMLSDGTLTHAEVAFYVRAEQQSFEPAYIRVNYYDESHNAVGGYDDTVPMEGKTFYPNDAMPAGYIAVDDSPVTVTMDPATGTLSHAEVAFNVKADTPTQPDPEPPTEPSFDPVYIRVNYYDPDNRTVGGYDDMVPMGGKDFDPYAALPDGYTLTNDSHIFVDMYADGTLSHSEVAFYVTPSQQPDVPTDPEPPVDPEQPTGPVVLETIERYGRVNGSVNLRSDPFKTNSNKVGSVKNAVLWGYEKVQNEQGEIWYKVRYEEGGFDCYVSGDYFVPMTQEESDAYANQGKTVDVTVRYVNALTEETLMTETLTCGYGESATATARTELLPDFTLQGEAAATVTVDGNGVATPAEVVFRFEPRPVEPVKGTLYVQYVTEDGAPVADGTSAELEAGSHPADAFAIAVPEGYTFLNVSADTVIVDENGVVTPETLTFVYRRVPQSAEINVSYQDSETDAEIYRETRTLPEGATPVAPDANAVPGYTLDSAEPVTVTVGADGVADINPVVFYATRVEQNAEIDVVYLDSATNMELYRESQTLGEGTTPIAPNADLVPGYTLDSAAPVNVTVGADGVADTNPVVFYATRVAQNATVRVSYFDMETEVFVETVELAPGEHSIAPDAAKVAGYDLASEEAVSVTVTADGVASPANVVFNVVRKAAGAAVTFEYVSTSGRAVADPLTATLSEKDSPVQTAEYAAAVEGYTLKSVSAETVTISRDGKADPARVTFTYEENATTARVEVHYRNSFGEDLAGSPVIVELGVGTHTISPDAARVPAGYTLSSSAQPVQVQVKNDLVAYPNSVSFTCYDAGVRGAVTVNYYDSTTNQLITTETRELTPGSHDIQPDEALVAKQGKYERADVPVNTIVTVSETGLTSPTVVVFYYKPAEVDVYQGFVITTRPTALRAKIGTDSTVLQTLPLNTVLYVAGQYPSGSLIWHSAQVYTGAPSGDGFVNDADVRRISRAEAEAIKKENDEANKPSKPQQQPGYYITLYDGVPMRTYTNIYAEIRGSLKRNTVVYVFGQELDGSGNLWHQATYDKVNGYIKDGQIRKMTDAEVEQYLAQGGSGKPSNPGGGSEYDPNGLSSYGYVSSGDVNFRQTPNGTKLKTLNRYAMALIIGTREVNGVTWYNVNYNGTIGWLHGDYFHQMTLTEFTSFVGSPQYYQGITNNQVNAPTSKPSGGNGGGGSTGVAKPGDVTSVEDWNVGSWENTGVGPQASYKPFNPYATPSATLPPLGEFQTTETGVRFYQSADESANSVVMPKDATFTVTRKITVENTQWYAATYQGRNGFVKVDAAVEELSATASPEPTATFVIGTMIPIDYEDETKETQTDTVPWGLIGAAIVLVGGAGGVYAYALNQNKRRKAAAARAAAGRRNAAAQQANGSPYARRAVAAPPVTGANRQQGAQQPMQQRPLQAGSQAYRNPYQSGSEGFASTERSGAAPHTNPYAAGGNSTTFTGSGANGANAGKVPYADGSLPQQSNPYAPPRPVQGSTVVPPAMPTQPGSNPYARPIAPDTAQSVAPSDENPVRRRATRMQRYHDAEGGNNDNT